MGTAECCKVVNFWDDVVKISEVVDKAPTQLEASMHNSMVLAQIRNQTAYSQSEKRQRERELSELIHNAKLLKLTVVTSAAKASLRKGQVFNINAQGLEDSKRGRLSGHTYFGSERKIGQKVINDIVIPSNESSTFPGRHFVINYEPENNTYSIRDLGGGYGVFARLDKELPIRDNLLLQLGESYVVFNMISNPMRCKLRVKIFGGSTTGEVSYFNSSQFVHKPIQIGRAVGCDVQIDDQLLSKCQASVLYDEEQKGWILIDGNYLERKPSTNGTWMYMNEDTNVYTGMIFKANHTIFQVQLI